MHPEFVNKKLDKRLKSLIMASYFGDGTITKQRSETGNCFLQIQHSEKQLEYAKYKADLFGTFSKDPIIVSRTFKGKPYKYILITTKVHPFLTKLRKHYDTLGNKRIKKWMFNYLDDQSLAIWYMDDGDWCSRKRTRNKKLFYKRNRKYS